MQWVIKLTIYLIFELPFSVLIFPEIQVFRSSKILSRHVNEYAIRLLFCGVVQIQELLWFYFPR